MNKLLLFMIPFLFGGVSFSQFQIGHTTITYNDPSRTGGFGSGGGVGRQIQCEIYYPATTAGENTGLVSGQYPLIVFGHGFAMSWDAYTNIWEHFVPQGYILVFPRTEGGLFPSPSHLDFGKDLVVTGNRFIQDCNTIGNFFEQSYNGKNAVMGHSMGGGASFLASAESNAPFDLVIGLAPAETDPLASSASGTISIPTLILSGSGDAVTPPANHHELIYNNITNSACNHFISILGGAHCYFANSNFNCDFGESSSGGSITIDRAEQQDVMNDILDPYLAFHLKKECSEWPTFLNEIATDTRIDVQNNCTYELPNGSPISLSGSVLSTNSTNAVQWYYNGNSIPGATNLSYDATTNYGNYSVTYLDSVVCSTSSATYNYQQAGLLIEENNKKLAIYPNPTSGLITIIGSENFKEFNLLSAEGKLIQSFSIDKDKTIDLSLFPQGVYFLQTESKVLKFTKNN